MSSPDNITIFFFYFDSKEVLSILLSLLVNCILTTGLFISRQAQLNSYLVPGSWCQTLLFTGERWDLSEGFLQESSGETSKQNYYYS